MFVETRAQLRNRVGLDSDPSGSGNLGQRSARQSSCTQVFEESGDLGLGGLPGLPSGSVQLQHQHPFRRLQRHHSTHLTLGSTPQSNL